MAAPATSTHSHIGRSLLFGLGDAYYRVELSHLKGVVAWAELQPSERHGVLGYLNLRGDLIPVIDLNDLVHGKPTPRNLGSRILLLECTSRGKAVTVGALAAEVFAMARDENSQFAEHFNPCEVLSSILAGLA
jgi:chemotaxis signal transduction protein